MFGKVEGNITVTDRCELKPNAEILGDITAGKIAIEEGASFIGSSRVGAAAVAAATGGGSPSDTNKGGGDKPKHNKDKSGNGGGDNKPGGGGFKPN